MDVLSVAIDMLCHKSLTDNTVVIWPQSQTASGSLKVVQGTRKTTQLSLLLGVGVSSWLNTKKLFLVRSYAFALAEVVHGKASHLCFLSSDQADSSK